jgi:hypothetical protein
MRLFTKSKLVIAGLLSFACCLPAYSQNYQITSTLRMDESRSFVLIQSDRKEYGFGVISSKGMLEWQIDLPGQTLGFGKSGNDVLVFYAENTGRFSAIKTIHAALIGIQNKKILKDKVIYTNPGKFNIEPNILLGPSGDFCCVLIRTTEYNPGYGGFGGNEGDKTRATKELNIISVGADIKPQVKEIKSIAVEAEFKAACAGNNNDLYIVSFLDDQIIAERFDANGVIKGKLSINAPKRRNTTTNEIIQYDSMQESCIDFAMSYINDRKEDRVQLYTFDFNNKKARATEEINTNKEYVQTLKTEGGNQKLRYFGEIYNLNPVQLIETNDKIIFLKEIQSFKQEGNIVASIRMGSIISIYTKDLKLLREVAIDKWSLNNLMGFPAISCHLKDDKLYTITNEKNGLGFKTMLYVINITDGSINMKQIGEKESGMNWLTIPGTVMWYNSNYIVPFIKAKASIHLNLETSLVSEKY